ncbi:Protein-L-isoaspartate O-methyltransferase [plant metagenome]|uniref:protein-L-isoaspartate(D-aspartate) O-methyltransferase n=1 Tax=plant metagenome TaxID=1297885 RepID=A0A484YF11_9ZZZZ
MSNKRSPDPSFWSKPGIGIGPRNAPVASPARGITTSNSNTRILAPATVRPAAVPPSVSVQGMPGNLGLNSDRMRAAMVQRLRQQGIADERVLNAMMAVPRHHFVDEALASRAYEDAALPIGFGQTISQPWVVAHMISAVLRDRKPQRVLEVGAGCGYQAAVLAQLIREVYAIERVRGLYDGTRDRLRRLRLHRVKLSFGDGMAGVPGAAPFDAIVVAAAGIEIPRALLEQLAVGGRLIAPEGTVQQRLVLIERTDVSTWKRTELEAVRFVPLRAGIQS